MPAIKRPTTAQLAKLHRLQEAARKAYKAWQVNHDKSKNDRLSKAWVKANKAADSYDPYK